MFSHIYLKALVIVCFAVQTAAATNPNDAPSNTSKAELKRIEADIAAVLTKIFPTVVCIESGNGSGSGVIVSEDGLVLTAAHVIDKGTDLTVVYQDGRRFKAKALGTYGPADAGMAQILEGAPHPFASVAASESLKINECVLSLGHPGGFDLQRGAPLRIGHLMGIGERFLDVDCALIGGDSGGPSFNLAGQVIGIHSHISTAQIYSNKDSSIRAFHEHWETMRLGEHHSTHYSKAISGGSNEDSTADESNTANKRSSEPSSPAANREATKLQELQRTAKENGGRLKLTREELLSLRANMAKSMDALAPAGGTRVEDAWGEFWSTAFRPACQSFQHSIHRVFVADRVKAMATAVGANGLLVTKASEIQGKTFEIELASKQRMRGKVVVTDNLLDLALVQIEYQELIPIDFDLTDASPKMGRLCASIGLNNSSIRFGTVSVAARPLDGKSGAYLGASVEMSGSGLLVRKIKPGSPAMQNGLRENDILLAVENTPLTSPSQLNDLVQSHLEGEVLRFEVQRDQITMSFSIKLGDGAKLAPMPGSREQATDGMSTAMSKRRWSFSEGIQHDCAIFPHECGGPLIDLDGRFLGINIARAGRIQSYTIPSSRVHQFVKSYQLGAKP
jgi:S1-C subfamily serine protease